MKNNKWTFKKLQEEALKYKSRKDFFQNSRGAYSTASNKKILNSICQHMTEVSNKPWTDEELTQEALKYNTRGEFQKNSNSAWQISRNRKILNKVCSHMPKHIYKSKEDHYNFKWSYNNLQKEALKYNNRSDFSEKSRGAYKSALSKNLLDDICKHMKISGPISSYEQSLFDIIKSNYNKTQILRIRTKRNSCLIENKPHIQGFDLDIYVPELRKGIEFDGKYWHSVNGLKRSRDRWPDEDLLNYHSIKDSWFFSNGIQILHIKEEDWIENKQKCIDKCFKFLNIPIKMERIFK